MNLPNGLQDCVNNLSKLPGVGEKTALRYALSMLNWNHQELIEFRNSILNLSRLNQCRECGLLCDEEVCHICRSESRKTSGILCVVENLSDCLAIEKSETFLGLYHILGGVLNPMIGVGPAELGIDKLVNRIYEQEVEEVILAINPSIEGDATCSFIKDKLSDSVNLKRIGFGIPIGGSLEHLDPMTISKALENKKTL